jgi:two-component system, OmpR family, response regulator
MNGSSDHAARIMIVDDDRESRSTLVDYLVAQDMSVVCVAGREDMSRRFAVGDPTLVLLELRQDRDDGPDLLREIRSRAAIPVIITTEHRREETDRIIGLELGADDYVTRPFNPRELLARIRAVLRRYGFGGIISKRDPSAGGYRFGGWQLNRRTRRLFNPEGAQISLTKGQYALLVAFLAMPGRALTREYLMQATRIREDVFDRSIDVQVLRLRRKLEAEVDAPRAILTERGVGYRFALPVENIPRAHLEITAQNPSRR